MTLTWTATIGVAADVAICGLCLAKGDREERAVASSLLLTFGVQDWLFRVPGQTHGVAWGPTTCSIMMLGVLFWCVATSQKRWLLVATAFQFLSVWGDLMAATDPNISTWTYMTASIILGYGMSLAMLFGGVQCALRDRRRRRSLAS